MSEELAISLKEIVEAILRYVQGKGQVPDLSKLFILHNIASILKTEFNYEVDFRTFLEYWSINAPMKLKPLWLPVVESLSQLNQKTEVVMQVSKRKKLE